MNNLVPVIWAVKFTLMLQLEKKEDLSLLQCSL